MIVFIFIPYFISPPIYSVITLLIFIWMMISLPAFLFLLKGTKFAAVIYQRSTEEIRGGCLRYNVDNQQLEKTPLTTRCLFRGAGIYSYIYC